MRERTGRHGGRRHDHHHRREPARVAENGLATDFVKLSIADTGTGMPPEVLARVFEPFFTTKDVGKGSGLGLPQVYGFAQQSGGRLTIDSEVGMGTIVTLLLPRSLQQPAAPKTTDTSSAPSIRSDSTPRGKCYWSRTIAKSRRLPERC